MQHSRSLSPVRLVAVLGLVALIGTPTLIGTPALSGAKPPDEKSTEEQRADVRARHGEVKVEIDVLRARSEELSAALATLSDNVRRQEGKLEEARRLVVEAEKDVEEADAAVVAAEARIAELDHASRQFVVDAFMNPPSENAFDVLDARTISDATLKHALIDFHADSEADVLDQLTAAHEDVEIERRNRRAVAAEAEGKRADAAVALSRLKSARAQQQAFADEVAAALDRRLAESAQLEAVDRELSRKIAEEQAALARRLAEEAAARARARAAAGAPAAPPQGPGTVTPVPGGLAAVSCPAGGSITVAGAIAPNVRRLLDASAADGVVLCGWGWRDAQRQIALRRAHCGGSDYAVWHMPAGACSPPTARPGYSMHESGLAIDFHCDGGRSIGSRKGSCFRWLSAHAADYGLHNLPSEPWHWSTNGH